MERELRKKGFFSPVLLALLAVLLLAGCTLTLLVIQFRNNTVQQDAQQAKDEAIAQQLEEIQLYLATVDQTLTKGQLSDADGYESLSQEVGAMQQNLTEYRDNNVIADDAIGQNLDDVIEQLSAIQENLEEERRASESLQEEMDTADDTASATRDENRQNVEQLQQTVTAQLSDVREDIRKLIRDASGENKADYQELLSVLKGTDSDLESFEKTMTSNHEKIQSAISNGLGNVNGSVSGLRDTVGSMQELLSELKEQSEQVHTQCTAILEGQGTLQNTMASERQSLLAAVENRQAQLEENIEKDLEKLSEQLQALQSESLEELRARTEELQGILDSEDYGLARLAALWQEQNEEWKECREKLEEQSSTLKAQEKLLQDLWDSNEERKKENPKEEETKEENPREEDTEEAIPSLDVLAEDTGAVGEQGTDQNTAEENTADHFTDSDSQSQKP